MADPVLELSNVEKEFGNDGVVTRVLSGVNLRVEAGELVAIIGPSGSGKSTLLNIIGEALALVWWRTTAHRRGASPRQEPPLVLADEPTGNLDTENSERVFELMRRYNRERGTAFVIVTHDTRIAERCARIVEVIDGRIRRDAQTAGGAAGSPSQR